MYRENRRACTAIFIWLNVAHGDSVLGTASALYVYKQIHVACSAAGLQSAEQPRGERYNFENYPPPPHLPPLT